MTEPGDQAAAAAGGGPGRGRLRASHADREQVVDALKAAFVQGRLPKDEFDTRVGQAFAARTYAELAALTADLPAARPPRKPAQAQARTSANTSVMACMRVITIAIAVIVIQVAYLDDWALLTVPAAVLTIFTASLVALHLMLESRHQKRSGRQLPPGPAAGAGGQPSPRQAPAGPAEDFPQIDQCQQHTAETALSRPACSQPVGSQPPHRRRPRGHRYAMGYAGH